MIHLMTVPQSLAAQVASEAAYVSGALVKDSMTHQILAHLQPTGRLTQMIFEVGSAGPAAPVTVMSSLVGNAQLLQIKDMLETLQVVAGVGAAASVLNLGVSIGGFAMVLSALRDMQGGIDKVLDTVKSVEGKLIGEYVGSTLAAIERAESAFGLPAPGDRRRYLEEADRDLHRACSVAVQFLAGQGVALEGPSAPPSAADTHAAQRLCRPESVELLRWMFTLSSARVEVLLGLQMPTEAARQSRKAAAWMSALPFSTADLAKAQLAGRTAPPTEITRATSRARAMFTFIKRSREVAEERALLCQSFHERGGDTLEYVLEVRGHPEATDLAVVVS